MSERAVDPRVDRMLSWGINAVSSIALCVAAWVGSSLMGKIDDLGKAVADLSTKIAVLENDRRDIERLEQKQDALIAVVADLRAEIAALPKSD